MEQQHRRGWLNATGSVPPEGTPCHVPEAPGGIQFNGLGQTFSRGTLAWLLLQHLGKRQTGVLDVRGSFSVASSRPSREAPSGQREVSKANTKPRVPPAGLRRLNRTELLESGIQGFTVVRYHA